MPNFKVGLTTALNKILVKLRNCKKSINKMVQKEQTCIKIRFFFSSVVKILLGVCMYPSTISSVNTCFVFVNDCQSFCEA